jgi:ElaB/YqjD/DUF883 family membrane-anchored ribosome-binding protein
MDDFPVFSRAQAQAQARDNLARNLRAALDDAEDLIRLTAEQAGEQVAAARARAQASVARARTELERVQAEAVQRTRAAARDVDDYVHSHPWQAAALAGVLSAVIGVLVSRR